MKEYPTGKHEEELLNVPLAMVGWRETAIPWNASWDAEVQSEVEDAHLC